ncbi:hypothetical protein PUNSTDRAFT_65442 [Punctularia strigosozonata HHB-11173 SS5]|uniref:uncharacterized protein n=1 Tax=Punctularia strigosozonata (strain HHB-11173) TaxID=741275 RepID=UPI00044179B5|nr:uncharacterized protein PUNSTDRAFT_65442 [Punctularia strigosozonata HHB-11173 SS5]EIN10368.1 hypothetical protein PUNSTDRAFT_65442 [Punctularia strigosozonata HHB-11173 SS5]
MDESSWKDLRLSLERPWKDDDGEHIPVLYDITPDGQQIYEPRDDPATVLGKNLRRIFVERGVDFFGKDSKRAVLEGFTRENELEGKERNTEKQDSGNASNQPMTPEELSQLRTEIGPHLHAAHSEMVLARDLLTALLATTGQVNSGPSEMIAAGVPAGSITTTSLAATVVSKPPPIPSVQAFDAQLVVGAKDEALRNAANILKSEAEQMEKARDRSEKYWVDALKLRADNWNLIPAPLPFGSAMGKAAERTSKDFLISYGLEESPALFRRRAIGHLATYEMTSSAMVFPHRHRTRMRVSLSTGRSSNSLSVSHSRLVLQGAESLSETLRTAQREIVEQEIFAALIREASNLPTASARVSERIVAVDAAQDTELRFEMGQTASSSEQTLDSNASNARADLIYAALNLLLLRSHTYLKMRRLGVTGVVQPAPQSGQPSGPAILQPIIDLLQYEEFLDRFTKEIRKVCDALQSAGIPCTSRFVAAGESGEQLVKLLESYSPLKIGGETLLRIDNRQVVCPLGSRHNFDVLFTRYTIRFTFSSPSTLTAHLPHATLPVASIPQLNQLLTDEVEQCILGSIRDTGKELCETLGGTWFVDLLSGRAVGRWDGCILSVHFTSLTFSAPMLTIAS